MMQILVYRHPFYQIGNRMLPVLIMVLLCFTSYTLSVTFDQLEVDLMLLLTITQFKMVWCCVCPWWEGVIRVTKQAASRVFTYSYVRFTA